MLNKRKLQPDENSFFLLDFHIFQAMAFDLLDFHIFQAMAFDLLDFHIIQAMAFDLLDIQNDVYKYEANPGTMKEVKK